MADTHIRQLRDIVIEWYGKDAVGNGDPKSYACGFADGMKFMVKRLKEIGILRVPDSEVFSDE